MLDRSLFLVRGFPEFFWQCIVAAIRGNHSRVAAYLRRKLYRTKCKIDTEVVITSSRCFHSRQSSWIGHGTYILNGSGEFIIGKNSHLSAFCFVNVKKGRVAIGDDVVIGPGTKIIAHSNHYGFRKKVTAERITDDVVIGDNVFIGANCTLLPGAVIGENVVIAAGSVVKGALDCNAIYGGVPCRKIRQGWYE